MNDFLIYREPQSNQVIRVTGQFELLEKGTKPSGFVVSDFLHQRIFTFKQEGEFNADHPLHFGVNKPVSISHRDYQIEAQAFLNAFPLLNIQKAVYSRVKIAVFPTNKTLDLFQKLETKYPNAFCYLISSKQFGTWIGATPELLFEQQGMVCKTVALASTHDANDHSNWTQKEQEEHDFVVQAIHEALQTNECIEIEKNGPFEHTAGPVVHLKTDFQALLTKPNAWEIVNSLHPTPAVCGTPRNAAIQLIESREMHQRELYTGFIGWFEEGNSRLFVNLRCAQLFKNRASLYVGGGFTIDSIPDLEWEETERKAETLLQFIQELK